MGLLDQLWDDTVAGPRPDSGLGRLRKPPAIRVDVDDAGVLACKGSDHVMCSPGPVESLVRDPLHTPPHVTRSIKIRRPPTIHGVDGSTASTTTSGGTGTGTPPLSPATPPPTSPFTGRETLWFLILD